MPGKDPRNPFLLQMIRELPNVRGVVIQDEDEIIVFGFCIGATLISFILTISTYRPGNSLFSKNIDSGIMAVVSTFIIDVQRMRPATGGTLTRSWVNIQFPRW